MGLFSKLRANMNHGGVSVRVQAPSTIASNEVIPVQVTLTADNPQTIGGVKVELKARMKEEGVTLNQGIGIQESQGAEQTIAAVESKEQITLIPGQPQTVTLQLLVNTNALGMGMVGGALGGVLQSVVSAAQAFNHVNFTYTLYAYAKVEGVAFDPRDKQSVQLLPSQQ